MLLLVTGASGAGKSTARQAIGARLPAIEAVELHHLGDIPAVPDLAWRQRMAERAAQRAVELDREGRHLLLAGDPVAPGEILAAPSAANLDVAVCLLDVREPVQLQRLRQRGEPEELLPNHVGFAQWMQGHARDPLHRPEVIIQGGWEDMQWQRWTNPDVRDRWRVTVIDTSDLEPSEVAAALVDWSREVLAGRAPVFRKGWF